MQYAENFFSVSYSSFLAPNIDKNPHNILLIEGKLTKMFKTGKNSTQSFDMNIFVSCCIQNGKICHIKYSVTRNNN